MAHPFGSISLGNYLHWARSVGCDCQTGYTNPSGSVFWEITAPSGRRVVIVDMQQGERLTSSYLNYLDRRLGLTSPFERVAAAE